MATFTTLKTDIADAKLGLDFINDLRTVTYKWQDSTKLDKEDSELVASGFAGMNSFFVIFF